MNGPRFITFALVALMAGTPLASAQEPAVSESAVRAEVEANLPSWWRLEAFEVVGADVISPAPPGKLPPPAPIYGAGGGGKPGAAPLAHQTVAFIAALRLTEQLYEPLYALNGTAMVREIMEPGYLIDVTGSLNITGEGDTAEFSAMRMDQGGVGELGRPLDEFGLPALVEGSEEAEAFLAASDEMRAQGTMNKIMGDAGEEL